MGVAAITPFGKCIKRRLLDIDRDQNWLINQVAQKTNLYFDRSYLHKIMTGRLSTPGIRQAICEMLMASMAVSAQAVTPKLSIKVPQISSLSVTPNVSCTNAVSAWLEDHPINIKITVPRGD